MGSSVSRLPLFHQTDCTQHKSQRRGDEIQNPVGVPLEIQRKREDVKGNGRQREGEKGEIIERVDASMQGGGEGRALFGGTVATQAVDGESQQEGKDEQRDGRGGDGDEREVGEEGRVDESRYPDVGREWFARSPVDEGAGQRDKRCDGQNERGKFTEGRDASIGFKPPRDGPKRVQKSDSRETAKRREGGGRGERAADGVPSDPNRDERVPGESRK